MLTLSSRGEVSARLGDLSLSHDTVVSRGHFESALLENPNDSRAIAGLADTYKFEDRFAEAEPLFERAVELAPDEPLNRLDLAEYLIEHETVSGEAMNRLFNSDGESGAEPSTPEMPPETPPSLDPTPPPPHSRPAAPRPAPSLSSTSGDAES